MNDKTSNLQPLNYEWISVLRGFAALLVFISHLKILPVYRVVLFTLGRIGVVCFFLITGFLTIQSRDRRSGKQYIINRLVRIYPVYWILLTLKYILLLKEYSFKEYVANATLFEEFIGFDAIIGESWMLPIQICFFAVVAIAGCRLFFNVNQSNVYNVRRNTIIVSLLSALAIITSILRSFTSKPFPVAIFLLLEIAVLGTYCYYYELKFKVIMPFIIVFEICLVVSVCFAYPNRILAYIVAYNIGIIIFIVFSKFVKNDSVVGRVFSKLGGVGYAFFLGASIPYVIFERYYAYSNEVTYIIAGCTYKFITSLLLAIFITKCVEKPILSIGKKLEQSI